MSSIPANLGRVPNALASRVSLANLGRTNAALLRVQSQIATGRAVLRPSDDIVRSATISVLDDRLERSEQLLRNYSHAESSLGVLDSVLGEANELALQAKSIASGQVGSLTTATDRASAALVVEQLIQGLFNGVNRESVAGYVLGGSQTSRPPVEAFLGGFRYTGSGPGLTTDLGFASAVPITLGSGNPLTATSTPIRGSVDLDPDLTLSTRLADLNGARGLGVADGTVQFSFNGSTPVSIDLSSADTIGDVATQLTAAIRQYETDNAVTILGPGGISATGQSLTVDVAPGSPAPALEFFEVGSGVTARDLGLTADTAFAFSPTTTTGVPLDPKLTWLTPVTSLAGVAGSLGSIRLTNAGRSATVDLSSAQTLQDVRNLIEGAGMGVRVVINADGTGIDVLNELSAGSAAALSISEVSGQGLTATRLGIRTLTGDTSLQDFNFGRGVHIVDGKINPTTGLPDPALNVDFRITLGDAAPTTLDIDLRPQDLATVQTLVDRINSEAAGQLAAAGLPATAFTAHLADGANGIALTQDSSFAPIKVETRNNSTAAAELGLLGGTYDPASATLIGDDRAKVRVDSLFSHLIDLREALATNNTPGIALAGEAIDGSIEHLVDTRGLVGGFAQRVDKATVRETDRATLDESTRSQLRDIDYTVAATNFTLLQTQLEAGLRVTALSSSQTLLDFLV